MTGRQLIRPALLACFTLCAASTACTNQRAKQPMLQNSALAAEHRDAARDLIHSDPAKAERLLIQAIEADPFDARAYNNLGVLLFRRGSFTDALDRFRTARRLDPSSETYTRNIDLARRANDAR